MVRQKQPQGQVKCEDQGSPQTGGKQCCGNDPPKPVVLSTPGGKRVGLGVPASELPPLQSHTKPLPFLIFSDPSL